MIHDDGQCLGCLMERVKRDAIETAKVWKDEDVSQLENAVFILSQRIDALEARLVTA